MPGPDQDTSADHVAVLRAMLTDPALAITLMKAGPDGIQLRAANETAIAALAAIAADAGWIETRRDKLSLSVEPRYTTEVSAPAGATLYHVSDAHRRMSIGAEGLKPGRGDNTTFARFYPDRLHLTLSLGGALAFVHHQATRPASSSFDEEKGMTYAGSVTGPRSLADLDIYTVTSPGARYFADSHFADGGIWTESRIAAAAVRLLPREEWEPVYARLYPPPPPLDEAIRRMMVPEAELAVFRSDTRDAGDRDTPRRGDEESSPD